MEKLNVMKSFVPVWVQQKSEIEKLRLNQSHTQNMNAVVFFLDISGFSKLAGLYMGIFGWVFFFFDFHF